MYPKMLGYTCVCCIEATKCEWTPNGRLKLLSLVYVLLRSRGARISGGSMEGGRATGVSAPQKSKKVQISSSYSAIKVRYLVHW